MKKAVCIGVNYAGTEFELRGCLNDAADWASLLHSAGFDAHTVTEKQATRAGILSAMSDIVLGLKPGDTGVITYSGHGTWIPDKDGDEPDRKDEAIVPYDVGDDGKNLIIDDELHLLFNKIPAGATVLWLTDCCHSGSVFRFFSNGAGKRKVRFIPPAHFITGGDLYVQMTRAFGQPSRRSDAPLPGLIHMSGCDDNEYSNDAEIDGRFCGAMTYYAIKAFQAALRARGTYLDAWKTLRKSLPNWEYQQTPALNAVSALKAHKLLG